MKRASFLARSLTRSVSGNRDMSSASLALALEPRFMYDAAGAATAATVGLGRVPEGGVLEGGKHKRYSFTSAAGVTAAGQSFAGSSTSSAGSGSRS